MSSIKVALICPVGPLDKWGYQNSVDLCLPNLTEFADRVYLVNSDYHQGKAKRDKVEWISTPVTWFEGGAWDVKRYADNIRLGCEHARMDGFDVAVNVSINWYAPLAAQVIMRNWWKYMVDTDEAYDQIYVRYQMGHHLMGASVTFPSVLNLHSRSPWQFTATDGIVNPIAHRELCAERRDWSKYNDVSFVDTGYELSLADLEAKLNYVKCYSDIIPSRSPKFGWKYWHAYYLGKVRVMPRSDDALDSIGQAIADRGDATFLSHVLAKELSL